MTILYASSRPVAPPTIGLQRCAAATLDPLVRAAVATALPAGIEQLTSTIAALLAQAGTSGEQRVLPAIVAELSSPWGFTHLLRQLLADEAALAAVQRHSYYHHNGFRKLVLLQQDNFKLRLHLWEARRDEHHENIHDHRWNFASCLLAGRFTTAIWEEDPTGPVSRLDCTYTSAQGGSAYAVHENGRVRLRQQATHTLQAGDLYYLPASTLHQVTDPGQGNTRSLMLTAAPLLSTCKLYAEQPVIEADKENVRFTLAAIRHELLALLPTVSPAQPAPPSLPLAA